MSELLMFWNFSVFKFKFKILSVSAECPAPFCGKAAVSLILSPFGEFGVVFCNLDGWPSEGYAARSGCILLCFLAFFFFSGEVIFCRTKSSYLGLLEVDTDVTAPTFWCFFIGEVCHYLTNVSLLFGGSAKYFLLNSENVSFGRGPDGAAFSAFRSRVSDFYLKEP